jgi:hypothetical protein
MGLVALSLNQRMRKTSPQPEGELASQGSTAVVPRRATMSVIGTGTQATNKII